MFYNCQKLQAIHKAKQERENKIIANVLTLVFVVLLVTIKFLMNELGA